MISDPRVVIMECYFELSQAIPLGVLSLRVQRSKPRSTSCHCECSEANPARRPVIASAAKQTPSTSCHCECSEANPLDVLSLRAQRSNPPSTALENALSQKSLGGAQTATAASLRDPLQGKSTPYGVRLECLRNHHALTFQAGKERQSLKCER